MKCVMSGLQDPGAIIATVGALYQDVNAQRRMPHEIGSSEMRHRVENRHAAMGLGEEQALGAPP
jgi:hypothetical protein